MDSIDNYLDELRRMLERISRDDIRAVVATLERTWRMRRTIYIIGNGGSAATASHMMNDLTKMTRVAGQPRVRALALTDNVPLMTAVANDQEYEDIFAEPLLSLLEPGDTVIAISASGNSPNILKAIDVAKTHGATVVGFCGEPGGQLAERSDVRVVVPAPLIGQQEDGHLILNHAVALALRERIAGHSTPTS